MNKDYKSNHIFWGLFRFKWYQRPWQNIKDIPIAIKRIFFTLKHGYAPQVNFDLYQWFIDTISEILYKYRNERWGTPFVLDEKEWDDNNEALWDENKKQYDAILDEMLDFLKIMNEEECLGDDENKWEIELNEYYKNRDKAKDKFFKLFSKYFYTFWD